MGVVFSNKEIKTTNSKWDIYLITLVTDIAKKNNFITLQVLLNYELIYQKFFVI